MAGSWQIPNFLNQQSRNIFAFKEEKLKAKWQHQQAALMSFILFLIELLAGFELGSMCKRPIIFSIIRPLDIENTFDATDRHIQVFLALVTQTVRLNSPLEKIILLSKLLHLSPMYQGYFTPGDVKLILGLWLSTD